MKTLYESILSSTKSGKLAFIKKWIYDNLFSLDTMHVTLEDVDKFFDIGPNGEISSKSNMGVDLDMVKNLPKEVKFKNIQTTFCFGKNKDYVRPEIFPKYANKIYVDGSIGTIPSFKMDITCALVVENNGYQLNHIEPIELHFVPNIKSGEVWADRYLGFANTKIKKEDLDNIKCTGESITGMILDNTPIERELTKEIKRIRKERKITGNFRDELDAYLDNYFNNFRKIKSIRLSKGNLDRIDGVGWMLPKGI